MPISEKPANINGPQEPAEQDQKTGGLALESPISPSGGEEQQPESPAPIVRGSRWVDYDTHELLSMISDLEDERRIARLREGIWIAILLHLALLSAVTWIPKYVFKVPQVIDPIDAIKQRKDLSYLDLPPDALKNIRPKVQIKPVKPTIDKKTLEAMNRPTPPPAPTPPAPQPPAPTPVQPQPTPPPPTPQPQLDAPRPAPVPARPNFAMGSQNPADQLRDAMKNAARNQGSGSSGSMGGSGLPMHPGAGGGVEVLSPTEGVDFSEWLRRWHYETQHTWDPLIPDEVNPPILKSGMVVIRFKILPNGRLMEPPNGMILEGRSGDTALDRAAWGALTGSNYPPLPREFHGPYLELRAYFLYNMQPSSSR